MQNKFNLIVISLIAIIFSACGKTENKSELEIMQVPSTVDTVCDTVETEIELHEFYDIFWPEFVAAAMAKDTMKLVNEMMHFPLKYGYMRTESELSKKDFLEMLAERSQCRIWGHWRQFLRFSEKFQFISVDKDNYYSEKKGKDEWGAEYVNQIKINMKFFEEFEEDYKSFFSMKFMEGYEHIDEDEVKLRINEKNVYKLFVSVWGEYPAGDGLSGGNFEEYYFAKRDGKYKLIAFHWYSP